MALKARLLANGCDIDRNLRSPSNVHVKKVHLYAHTPSRPDRDIPEDVLLTGSPSVICRIRYNPTSALGLRVAKNAYVIEDSEFGEQYAVELPPRPQYWGAAVREVPLASLFSFLGLDVLGVAPSNSCFYFAKRSQCRFCEIVKSFTDHVDYAKATKPASTIVEGVDAALALSPAIRHFAVTSGNLVSYDETCRIYLTIARATAAARSRANISDVLATLMPPDDTSLIAELRRAGFTKVYFPIEVYRRDLFEFMCPGKHVYGYDRILAALQSARAEFGDGNVYTNFIYGIQSLNTDLAAASYSPAREREVALEATQDFLDQGVIPAFTVYHYSGANPIGAIALDASSMNDFFCEWGRLVRRSNLVATNSRSVLFGPLSLSNTLFNDGYGLACASESQSAPA